MQKLIPREVTDLIRSKPEVAYLLLAGALGESIERHKGVLPTPEEVDQFIWLTLNTWDANEVIVPVGEMN